VLNQGRSGRDKSGDFRRKEYFAMIHTRPGDDDCALCAFDRINADACERTGANAELARPSCPSGAAIETAAARQVGS
jgi:hypothetical protein